MGDRSYSFSRLHESFITNRTQSMSFAGRLSSSSAVTCGVAQGCVLGPVFFLVYTADVLNIDRRHRMVGHFYADDTQVYSHFSWNMCNANVLSMFACIGDINRWMASNWLKLNTDKTDFILLGTRQQLGKTSLKEIDINGIRVPVSTTVSSCSPHTSDVLPAGVSTSSVNFGPSVALSQLKLQKHLSMH